MATNGQLAELVRDAIPAPARRTGGHPAKRTFQAIRIAVNEELDILPATIDSAIDVLAPPGRCPVLSYHSGEDPIANARFPHAPTRRRSRPAHLPPPRAAHTPLPPPQPTSWRTTPAPHPRH